MQDADVAVRPPLPVAELAIDFPQGFHALHHLRTPRQPPATDDNRTIVPARAGFCIGLGWASDGRVRRTSAAPLSNMSLREAAAAAAAAGARGGVPGARRGITASYPRHDAASRELARRPGTVPPPHPAPCPAAPVHPTRNGSPGEERRGPPSPMTAAEDRLRRARNRGQRCQAHAGYGGVSTPTPFWFRFQFRFRCWFQLWFGSQPQHNTRVTRGPTTLDGGTRGASTQ